MADAVCQSASDDEPNAQRSLLDLPTDVLNHILRAAPRTSRQLCRAFRTHLDATCETLELRLYQLPASQRRTIKALLGRLPHLTHLELCAHDAEIQPTAVGSPALTSIKIIGSHKLTDLSHVGLCTALLALELARMDKVASIKPLASCAQLASLSLRGLFNLRDVRPIAALTGLTSLCLASCSRVSDVEALSTCTRLESLSLASCNSMHDIGPLASCTRLTMLDLGECRAVDDISALDACRSLRWLSLHNGSIDDVTALGRHPVTFAQRYLADRARPSCCWHLNVMFCHAFRRQLLPGLFTQPTTLKLPLSCPTSA